MAERALDRWLRPRYVFSLLALIVLAAVVFSPQGGVGANATRLTSYSSQPAGAQGIYDVLARLGWDVSRRRTPLRAPLDTSATYLLLAPPIPPSATEVGTLLDAVRAGADAIVAPSSGSPLADSLGVARTPLPMGYLSVAAGPDTGYSQGAAAAVHEAAMGVHSFSRFLVPQAARDEVEPRYPSDLRVLVQVEVDTTLRPAIAARRFGAGRVLVLADPLFLRNGDARDTSSTVLMVRLLEWLALDRQRPVVFDEYHQGFGDHASLPGTIARALAVTAPGRMVLQLLAAALVLLVAIGVRPIAPTPRQRIERRSPLEHVGALAQAYEQIDATRLATRRLVRGLRRRHPMGVGTSLDDERYLALLPSRKPALADDARLLGRALAQPLPVAEWVAVGGAIDHIERTITQ